MKREGGGKEERGEEERGRLSSSGGWRGLPGSGIGDGAAGASGPRIECRSPQTVRGGNPFFRKMYFGWRFATPVREAHWLAPLRLGGGIRTRLAAAAPRQISRDAKLLRKQCKLHTSRMDNLQRLSLRRFDSIDYALDALLQVGPMTAAARFLAVLDLVLEYHLALIHQVSILKRVPAL